MKIYDSGIYQNSIRNAAGTEIPWDKFSGKKLLIAGATGLIGRFFIDLLMYKKEADNLDVAVTALSRSETRARNRFKSSYFDSDYFTYKSCDLSKENATEGLEYYDYILNLASNTHPLAYAKRPIETIVSNVYGTRNLLELCARSTGCRFILPSSVEIYGENRGDTNLFSENYCGYLDSNTLRAGYPESKRVCESLCQAYIREKDIDAVIVRLPRVYGPTMGEDDSKALAQFIKKAVVGEDIVLKSEGSQEYSYLYVADVVGALLTVMLYGKTGESYNAADPADNVTLKQAAILCAEIAGVQVKSENPDSVEKSGYSTATKALLNGDKIKNIGWKCNYNMEGGLRETIAILKGEAV